VRVSLWLLLLGVALATGGIWLSTDRLAQAWLHRQAGQLQRARELALAARVEDPALRNRVLVPVLLAIAADRDRSANERAAALEALPARDPAAAAVLDPLLRWLRDPTEHPAVRGAAAGAIGALGPEARQAVPILLSLLLQQDAAIDAPDLTRGQLTALRVRDDEERDALAVLLGLLDQLDLARPDPELRPQVVEVLHGLDPGVREALRRGRGRMVVKVGEHLGIGHPADLGRLRQQAVLDQQGLTPEQQASLEQELATDLLATLRDVPAQVRAEGAAVVQALARIETAEQGLRFQRALVAALGEIGPAARGAREALLARLLGRASRLQPDQLWDTCQALGRIDHQEGACVAELTRCLAVDCWDLRRAARFAVRELGPVARRAAPELRQRPEDGLDWDTLARLGPLPDQFALAWLQEVAVAPVRLRTRLLTEAWEHGIRLPPSSAPLLLQMQGGAAGKGLAVDDGALAAVALLIRADPAHPELRHRLEWWLDRTERLRQLPSSVWLAEALGELPDPPPEALPLLRRMLGRSDTARIPPPVVTALGRIGPPARGAVDELLALLDGDAMPEARAAVPGALVRIDPEHPELVTTCCRLAGDEDEAIEVRVACVQALGRLGGRARAATDELRRLLGHHDLRLHLHAAAALVPVTGRTDPFLERLLAPFARTSSFARVTAAAALAELGPRGRAAGPVLRGLVQHPDTQRAVREAAARALAAIDGPDPGR
jgi:hypothetical protein